MTEINPSRRRARDNTAMDEDDLLKRMAELLVEVLEVGSPKPKRDVIDEIFEAFGMNFADLEAGISLLTLPPNRAKSLRARAASQLAEAAPTATALLNATVHYGARFVAMLDQATRAVHVLWYVLIFAVLLWLIGFFVGGAAGGGRRWYGRW